MKTRTGDPSEHLISMLTALGLHRGIVLAVTHSGVRLADRIARGLGAPLDIVPARKVVVVDGHSLAIGAVAIGGVRIIVSSAIATLGLTDEEVERHLDRAAAALTAEDTTIRAGAPMPDLAGRTAILVDDGAVTGLTMAAAAASVRDRAVAQLVAVVPYCSEEAVEPITNGVQRLVAIEKVRHAVAVQEHTRLAMEAGPPLSAIEIHDVLTRRLRDLGLGTGAGASR
jgi:putative phosphoribosyl transferase